MTACMSALARLADVSSVRPDLDTELAIDLLGLAIPRSLPTVALLPAKSLNEKYEAYVSSRGLVELCSAQVVASIPVPRATERDGQGMDMLGQRRAVAALLAAVSVSGVLALGGMHVLE